MGYLLSVRVLTWPPWGAPPHYLGDLGKSPVPQSGSVLTCDTQ